MDTYFAWAVEPFAPVDGVDLRCAGCGVVVIPGQRAGVARDRHGIMSAVACGPCYDRSPLAQPTTAVA